MLGACHAQAHFDLIRACRREFKQRLTDRPNLKPLFLDDLRNGGITGDDDALASTANGLHHI
jgi:hypothetical protein